MGAFSDALSDFNPQPYQSKSGRPVVYIPTGEAKPTKSPFESAMDDFSPPAKTPLPKDDAPASFTRRFEAIGPVDTTTSAQKLLTNQENEGAAAGQLTTPNIPAQQKNYISSRVYENDAGELLYEDLDTGELKKTDRNKHVVLRDPADNRLKVYGRDDNTNESRATAAGRLLRIGTMSQAPTVGATAATATAPLLTQKAPAAITPGQEVSAAAGRIGVDLPKAVTSDSTSMQWAGKTVSNIPFAGNPLRNASENAIGQLGQAATDVQQGFGAGSVPRAGEAVRGSIERYAGPVTQARQKVLYDKIDNLVDAAHTTDLSSTRNVAQKIISRRENAAITQPSEAVRRIEDAITRPGGMNFHGIKDLRTYIGEMMEGRSPLPADMSQAELKQIYGALSNDLRVSASASGGERGLAAFDRANNYTRLVSERRENLMRILGAKSDEGIFDRLVAAAGTKSRADINLLSQARKAAGADSWDELSSAVISRLGRDANGDFSPDRFLTAFGKLSTEGKNLLFRSTGKPELANALDDIHRVSERFHRLNQFANPSGTGQAIAGAAELTALITTAQQTITTGSLVPPLLFLGQITTGRVLAHILATPKTAESTARWAKTYEMAVTKPTQATIQSFRQASKVLASNVGSSTGRLDLVPELTSRLQDLGQARAKENKKH